MREPRVQLRLLVVGIVLAGANPAAAQRIRFPAPITTAPTPFLSASAQQWGSPVTPPSALPPVQPGAALGQGIQPFDPYATSGVFVPPAQPAPPGWIGPGVTGGISPTPAVGTGGFPASPFPAATPSFPAAGPPPAFPGPATPGATSLPPTQPSAVFPNGLLPPGALRGPPYERLFQDTGMRATYLYGEDVDELAITEVEASTTAYFASFLRSTQALRVTPGFVIDFLSGPSAPVTSDLPGAVYSAYLDAFWNPQITPQFRADLNARVGIYSDFNSITTESLRWTGTGVGVLQVTPAVALKAGATYLDRVDLKLLPAFGVLWEPNPQTRFDIFFPAPKLAHYMTTVGNSDVWWYLGAEYGLGSWTIERTEAPMAGASDRVDINDIRVFGGVEWTNLNRFYGFLEVGYVFNRELVYYLVPADSVSLKDTFMLSGGFSF